MNVMTAPDPSDTFHGQPAPSAAPAPAPAPARVVSLPSAGAQMQTPSAVTPRTPGPVETATAAPNQRESKTWMDLKVDQHGENILTFLADGDVVNGSLEVRGGARIAGVVMGSLICRDGSAIIEQTGAVGGSVVATRRVIVAGQVGAMENAEPKQVTTPDDVIVLGTGIIVGDVRYGNLVTYDGGRVRGRVQPYEEGR